MITYEEPLWLAIAFVIGTLAVTRVVRLIVDDEYPPMQWATQRLTRVLPEKWETLVECPWCVAPYVTLGNLAWAWGTDLHWTWWFANVWAAVSWLAAYLNLRDIPPEDR